MMCGIPTLMLSRLEQLLLLILTQRGKIKRCVPSQVRAMVYGIIKLKIKRRGGQVLVNISSLVMSVGFSLMVIGVRFIMVKNNLKLGKPSNVRLKAFKKEWSHLLPAGLLVFLIGFFSPSFSLSVEEAKSIASTGGVLFGLGIPQYVQWDKGRGNEEQIKKSANTIGKWAWALYIVGGILVIGSPFIKW